MIYIYIYIYIVPVALKVPQVLCNPYIYSEGEGGVRERERE